MAHRYHTSTRPRNTCGCHELRSRVLSCEFVPCVRCRDDLHMALQLLYLTFCQLLRSLALLAQLGG